MGAPRASLPTEVATVAEQLRQALAARELAAANLKRAQQLHASGLLSSPALDDARPPPQRAERHVAPLPPPAATRRRGP